MSCGSQKLDTKELQFRVKINCRETESTCTNYEATSHAGLKIVCSKTSHITHRWKDLITGSVHRHQIKAK